jgi:DNA polymerase I-like protein with 3'-5' exonuclease and polymerase domains
MDLIYGCGPDKGILFLEDYPSEDEFAQKKPLIGANLNLIKRILYGLQINPESFYRTCFFKRRHLELQVQIRRNKFRWHSKQTASDPDYFQEMLDLVIAEFIEIQPKVAFICGELPLNALTKRKKIRKYRGSILELADWIKIKYPTIANTLIIPLVPLRDQFADPNLTVFTQLDLQKGIKYSKEQFVHPDKRYILTVAYSAADFYGFLERCPNPEYRTIDIETNNNFITCLGFCLDGKEAISVPWIHMKEEHRPTLMKAVANYIAQPIPTVNQNILYDDTLLTRWGMPIPNISGDTMLLAHTLYPEFPKGLDFLTSIYTDIEYYKDDVKDMGSAYDPEKYKERLYIYNAKDALTTHIIYKQQLADAEELGVLDFYKKSVMPIYGMYKRINQTGLLVDDSKRKQLLIKYKTCLDYNMTLLKEMLEPDENINWDTLINSPKQVAYLIYDYMGCPEISHWKVNPKTGERMQVLSTDEDAIEELIINRVKDENIKKVLSTILICRKFYRIINWLLTPCDYDGKMYTWYNQVGTESGRTSASERPDKFRLWEDEDGALYKKPVGYSFQTIPKHGYELPDGSQIGDDLLEIFIPHDGNIFIEGDKSQAEARVVTVLSENYDLLPYFDRPPGIHRLTASWIVGGDPFKILKTDSAYDKGKRARHAGNYGMGPARLSQMTHLSYEECEIILFKFHKADPSIRDVFHYGIKEALHNGRVLITPFGRRREFFGRLDEDTFKEAFSYIPQSTVSDDIKRSGRELMERSPWALFPIEKHDSILAEIPRERKDEYVELWKDTMEKPINFNKCTLIRDIELVIPTELQWSETNLSELKDLK